jgi:hypothetical protein
MPFIPKSLRRLANLFQQRKTPDALIECVGRALRVMSGGRLDVQRYYLFSQPVEKLPKPGRRGAAIEVRALEASDPLFARLPRPLDETSARLSGGALCVVAQEGGALAGFLWLQPGTAADLESGVRFAPAPETATVWDFDVYIDPQYRGGLAFYRLWSRTGELLRERGVAHSVSLVWAHNDDSIRSHQRLGAYPVASGLQVRIGRGRVQFGDRPPRLRWLSGRREAPRYVVDASARKGYARFPLDQRSDQRSTSAGAG